MTFSKILMQAKNDDSNAVEVVFNTYRPLIISQSMIDKKLDDDLFQENCAILLRCIKTFEILLEEKKEKNEK